MSRLQSQDHLIDQGILLALLDPEHPGDGRKDERRVPDGSKRDEQGAVREVGGTDPGGGECQARLADPP
ncbi:MAG TPA: hypothetical protein VGT61_06845 [Thermomicrobiales bacterium]|nr:hypothetical protein [Thermomicrobiales bacterium]